jgi:hypothetical protein
MKSEGNGDASGHRMVAALELTPGELRIVNAAGEAIEAIMNASPQARVKRAIERAALIACASEEGRIDLANQIVGFARRAPEFLERGDYHGLEQVCGQFERAVIRAAQTRPPQPALMPSGESFRQFGWSSEDRQCLQTVLFYEGGMLGAKKGDVVASIDEESATLSSGLVLSKSAIVAACVPASQAGR